VNDAFLAQKFAFEIQRNNLNVVCTGDVKFRIKSTSPVPTPPSDGEVMPPGPTPSNETVTPSNETVVPPSGDGTTPTNETVVPSNETVVPANETIVPSNETIVPTDETIPSN
jgi:hypothetical protein